MHQTSQERQMADIIGPFHPEHALLCLRLSLEIERLRASCEWQPIETAPKDGTKIICYSPEAPGGKIRVTWYRNPSDHAGYLGWGEFNMVYWPPTHWMPLPEPPVLAEGDKR
jgi:hypothetical protein